MAGAIGVKTTAGKIEGRANGGHVSFRGIPYAHPPAGRLRFAAPDLNTGSSTVEVPFDDERAAWNGILH